MKRKRLIALLISLLSLALMPTAVFSSCPESEYSPYELRAHIRSIIFNYLTDPVSSPYTREEILDLLSFYRAEKDKSLIGNCDVLASPSSSNEQISFILAQTIVFQEEC